jgi:hypothetical protein
VNADSQASTVDGAARTLLVQAVFRPVDERQAQSLAAQMVDSAHRIANMPECECDVDVNIELSPDGARAADGSGGAPDSAHPVKH